MEVPDSHGMSINKGGHVRYSGTGTSGEVLDVREDLEGTWAKMDSTNLWYNSRYLEVIKKEDYIKVKNRELKKRLKADEEVEKEVMAKKTIEELKKKIGEDVDMSNELCDGGG